MKTFLKMHISLLIVSGLALIFFLGTSSYNYLTQTPGYVKWSSPDETANYFFAREYAQTGQLAVFDPAGAIGDNLVMPRSVRSDVGWVKPVSFLGIILIYGKLAQIFGITVIPYLTPFFGALGIIFFYLLIRRLFSERVGLWSAFLLAVFPVYVYYSVRSMFHNVLFLVLLIIGTYFSVLSLGEKLAKSGERFLSFKLSVKYWAELVAALFGGWLVGLAVITRTSELLWLAPVLFLVWLFYARRLGLAKTILFLSGLFIALVPVAYYNQILYGSFWHGGYNEMNRSLDNISKTGSELWRLTWTGQFNYYRHYLGEIFYTIFHFGFKPDLSTEMFRRYVTEMFPLLLYPGLAGLLLLFVQNIRRFQKKYLVYVLSWLILSVILVYYYGSWKFNDNPDPNKFTIGNSYTRYWLPLYLGLMPLAALVIVRVTRAILFIRSESAARFRQMMVYGLQALAIAALAAWSLLFVLSGSEEGLFYLYYNGRAEKVNTLKVWSLTEPDAVIITRYYDKFFWPERRVIMGTLPDEEILRGAAKIAARYPVYYYNFYLDGAAVQYLNERKLPAYGLEMDLVKKVNSSFGLYRLKLKFVSPAAVATSTAIVATTTVIFGQ